jgi:hypothetical protein
MPRRPCLLYRFHLARYGPPCRREHVQRLRPLYARSVRVATDARRQAAHLGNRARCGILGQCGGSLDRRRSDSMGVLYACARYARHPGIERVTSGDGREVVGTVRTLGSPGDHQCVSVPPKAGYRSGSRLSGQDALQHGGVAERKLTECLQEPLQRRSFAKVRCVSSL